MKAVREKGATSGTGVLATYGYDACPCNLYQVIKMNKDKFRLYFHEALDRAVTSFAKVHGPIARKPDRFEVHAPGPQGRAVTEAEAIEAIFLGESQFYKIIDVAVLTKSNAPRLASFVSAATPHAHLKRLSTHKTWALSSRLSR